jgi:hypothetical protein
MNVYKEEIFGMSTKLIPWNSELLRTKTQVFNFQTPQINPIQLHNELVEELTMHEGLGLSSN